MIQHSVAQTLSHPNRDGGKSMHNFHMVGSSGQAGEVSTALKTWSVEFNETRKKLSSCKQLVHDMTGQVTLFGVCQVKKVVTESIGKVHQELSGSTFIEHNKHDETLHPCDRDKFTNLGANLFICGLFLILMNSNAKNDKCENVVNLLLDEWFEMSD